MKKIVIIYFTLFYTLFYFFSLELGESKQDLLDSLELFGYKNYTYLGLKNFSTSHEKYMNLDTYGAKKNQTSIDTTYGFVKTTIYTYFFFKDDILIAIRDDIPSYYNNIQPLVSTYLTLVSEINNKLGTGIESGDIDSNYINDHIENIDLLDKNVLLGKIQLYCEWNLNEISGALIKVEKIKDKKEAYLTCALYLKIW